MSTKVSINFIEGMGPKVGIDFKTGISFKVALIQKWELLSKLDVGTNGGIGLSQMRLILGLWIKMIMYIEVWAPKWAWAQIWKQLNVVCVKKLA